MSYTIIVKKMFNNALTESNGIKLRNEVEELMKRGEKNIVVDFTDIALFASPFFNAFIGYFLLNYDESVINSQIELINLSSLGEETYEHSYNNAINVLRRKIDTDKVGEITQGNIGEC